MTNVKNASFALIFAFCFCFAACMKQAVGQRDSSFLRHDTLAMVQINDSRQEKTTRFRQEKTLFLTDIPLENTLELLQRTSEISLKSYGVGNVATVSIRGLAAEQTRLYWDDLPLNSPTLAQSDFSLLNAPMLTNLSLDANNGAIKIATFDEYDVKTKLNIGNTNGRNWQANLSIPWSLGRNSRQQTPFLQGQTVVFGEFAKNDFLYKTSQKSPPQPLSHAKTELYSALQTLLFTINKQKKNTIELAAWLQETDRDLPPLLSQTMSRKNQKDGFFRLKTTWKLADLHKITAAYCREKIDYNDTTTNIFAKNTSERFFLQGATKQIINKTPFTTFQTATFTHDAAKTDFYSALQTIDDYKFCIGGDFKSKQVAIGTQITAVKNRSFIAPVLYQLSLDYEPISTLSFSLKHEKRVRFPSLNDLFWQDGNTVGNPNLLPEQTMSSDFSIIFNKKSDKMQFNARFTPFYLQSEQQIQWVPLNTGGWSPKNIGNVVSKGITSHFSIEKSCFFSKNTKKQAIKTIFDVNYTYTEAKVYKDSLVSYAIYTPLHQAAATFRVAFGSWHLASELQYNGARFTNFDAIGKQANLPAYFLLNSTLSYQQKARTELKKKMDYTFFFKANNMLNTFYQSYANRPTALLFFNGGVSLSF